MQNTVIHLVIFDMDGLMFDTERISFLSFQEAIAAHGETLDEATFYKTLGANLQSVRQIYTERFGPAFPFDAMLQKKFACASAHIAQNGVPVKPGLYELLYTLTRHKIKKAVATSSNRSVATHLLSLAKIDRQFDAIICGDDIERSKPDPDIFLKAAAHLHCSPESCLVLEDSAQGILAAQRAGMRAILIPDLLPPDVETAKRAFRVMNTLADVKKYILQD